MMIGNTPPWQNALKAKQGTFDRRRAAQQLGLDFDVPKFFPIMSLLVLYHANYSSTR